MAYRGFISHGWSDLWVAQQIERRIRQDAKAQTFIDAVDITKGDDFEDRIFAEMRQSDELVVLFTPWSSTGTGCGSRSAPHERVAAGSCPSYLT